MKEVKITRTRAAAVIDKVRELLAKRSKPEDIEAALQDEFQIVPLSPCTGEAHNPAVAGQIDNCGVCAPRWGLCGDYLKIT